MSTTPTITGTDFVMLPVSDLDRAKAFYGDTLGLRATANWGNDGQEYETGSLTIALAAMENLGQEVRPGTGAIALRVDDVAEARAALEARGVAFVMDTIDSGVCHQAIFRDPDGNTLILHHRYAPPPGG